MANPASPFGSITGRKRRWSKESDYQLLMMAGLPVRLVAARLGRSEKSIRCRLRRLGMNAEFFGGYKTKDLVRDLRVDERTVNSWVRWGWLKRKAGRISEASIARLCREHPDAIPFSVLHPDIQQWLTLSFRYLEPETGRDSRERPESDSQSQRTT